MKKYTIIIIMVIAIVFIFYQEETNFPATYKSLPIAEIGVKVFTKNGEIKKATLIKDYIHRFGDHYNYLHKNNWFHGDITATFLNSTCVIVSSSYSNVIDTLVVYEKENLIYWEKKDTTTIPGHFPSKGLFNYRPLHYNELKRSNQREVIRMKECLYVRYNNPGYKIPMLYVYFKDGNKGANNYSYGIYNNKLSRKFLSTLDANDTLFIYEYFIELKK